MLDDQLGGPADPADTAEQRARQEKTAALQELAEARFSVLVGPAGTGKTTLLAALCQQPAIADNGVILLAPTGKARVQLARNLGDTTGIGAKTVAGFLLPSGRYDPDTGAYRRSPKPRAVQGGTVIIDEASMLTEEQLDAILDNITGVERLILVGDHRQLPPIGPGRPFVDIVEQLRPNVTQDFPRVGDSYTELTVLRRQVQDTSDDAYRHDLALAQFFGGDAPGSMADETWGSILAGEPSATLRFAQWDNPTQVFDLLKEILVEEIEEIADEDDQLGFGASLGGAISGDYVYFNMTSNRGDGAGKLCEAWQVLTPINGTAAGVVELNRAIHQHFRADLIDMARNEKGWTRRVPKPMGPENIVYGDKVLNNRNHAHKDYWPKEFEDSTESDAYVANGEIGMTVGQFKSRGKKFRVTKLEVEFSTQVGVKYGFGGRYMPNDGNAILELAYTITVHKSQGSEFGTTFLIVPNPCRPLTRELMYTALTRQTKRVVVLHQGPLSELLSFSDVGLSETARRYTNLFNDPDPVDVGDGRYLESGLIHRSASGTLLRSKSEVIIANQLEANGIDYIYEKPYRGNDGRIRLPDFTIEDDATGEVFLWEHLGMLSNPDYAAAWDRKKAWYEANDVTEDGTGEATLIVTTDDERGGVDSPAVDRLIHQHLS